METGHCSHLTSISNIGIVTPIDNSLQIVFFCFRIYRESQHCTTLQQHATTQFAIHDIRWILANQGRRFITSAIISKVREVAFHAQKIILIVYKTS